MSVLYNIFLIILFNFLSVFNFLFSKKINYWLKEQKKIKFKLQEISNKEKKNWFHCASLGEYEQIQPIIKQYETHSKKSIIITVFSPTAYKYLKKNITKNVFLLPIDIKKNMDNFIKKINPENIFIAKNELWPNMINISFKKSIPIYMIGVKIKQEKINNIFYGRYYCNMLKKINTIFVQDSLSKKLLEEKNVNCILSGDPRIDQVILNTRNKKKDSIIIRFCQEEDVIIAGSTEQVDYKYLIDSINSDSKKWIIVPHENSKEEINYITKRINAKWSLYSNPKNIKNSKILIIDKIGILKHLYNYAKMIYIGGGFSKGIHNCLEPAIFGKPLFFGPNYKHFPEAKYFVQNKIARIINSKHDLKNLVETETIDYQLINKKCLDFFKKNQGASKKIIEYLIR